MVTSIVALYNHKHDSEYTYKMMLVLKSVNKSEMSKLLQLTGENKSLIPRCCVQDG